MNLIFEKSKAGRGSILLPECDVPEFVLPEEMQREQALRLPELSETEISRHYTALAKRAHGVNDGFYPLGSCTMKYNPRIDEEMAALPGFANIHPLQPADTVQGCKHVLETAKQYLASGNYTWNSGMFGFKADVYLSELEKCEPDAYFAFSKLATEKDFVFSNNDNIKILENWAGLDEMCQKAPRISIDKALAEKTKEACTVKATFSWEDIGSWDSFEKLFTENQGKVATVDSENCFVYSDIPVALCGVKDLVVVMKNNKLLVMKKNCSPLVKDAVHILEKDESNK